jgi:hypothetical protein
VPGAGNQLLKIVTSVDLARRCSNGGGSGRGSASAGAGAGAGAHSKVIVIVYYGTVWCGTVQCVPGDYASSFYGRIGLDWIGIP